MNDAPGEHVSVLLIEDDLVDEMATLRIIKRQSLPWQVQVARTVTQARAVLGVQAFDVILADFQLADGNSFDLMDDFGEQLVIFVTGAWDETIAARALRLGVHDYLVKDDDRKYLQLLNYRVQTALRLRRTERRLRDSEARLQAILDHAPASISARDGSGRLILSNRHHGELAPSPLPDGAALVQTTAAEAEETLTLRDGSERTYLTVRFPMPGATGRAPATGSISVDITARKQAEQQIRQLAFYDPLTGLPNRRMLFDRLQQAFATSARHGACGALFFIDLDHFKTLNDTLGHDHGDLLLVEVAQRLLSCVRGEDTVARIGGDEFVVMIVGLSGDEAHAAAQAVAVGEKIIAAVGQPCQLREHSHVVTPSVGVSLFHGRTLGCEELVKRADVAMYQAKTAGRGCMRFFDPLMQAALDERLALDVDLRHALALGQFELHFQAQVEGRHEVIGAEALLRWRHPRRGLLLPARFLPLAEQNGLILPLGRWVVEAACEQLGRWATDPTCRGLQLAVNVSGRQFRQDGFAEHVTASLLKHGAPPGRLRLELREGTVQDHPALTLARMNALRDSGVGFAMDDFGISYSSLSHLKRLPLQQIKIAASLTKNLTTDAHDAAIVKTILGISRDLGLSAIAAGVETVQQRTCLAELGCSLWQGYLFGPPAPLREFERRLATVAA